MAAIGSIQDYLGSGGSLATGGFMGGQPGYPGGTLADPTQKYGSIGAPTGQDVNADGSPRYRALGDPAAPAAPAPAAPGLPQYSGPYNTVISDPNFDPNAYSYAPGAFWSHNDANDQTGDAGYYTVATNQGPVNAGGSGFFSGLGDVAHSLAPVVAGGLLGGGVLGATGAQATGNAALGRDVGENLGNAGLADLAGAGATAGAVLGGGGAAGAASGQGFEGAVPQVVDPLEAAITGGQTAQLAGTAADPLALGVNAATAGGGAAGAGGIGSGLVAGGAATGGAAAGGTALSRALEGGASNADLLSLLGVAGATGLGIAGAHQQANASDALAGRLFDAGQASRDRFNASMTPGFDPTTIPGYSGALQDASQSILRGLSTQGNPFGNPGGLIEANKQIVRGTALPAVQAYQNANAAAGGFGALAAGAPGAGANAVNAQGGIFNAIGSGISSLTNPQPSLADTLRLLGLGRGATSAA